jgi:hypothetical protein
MRKKFSANTVNASQPMVDGNQVNHIHPGSEHPAPQEYWDVHGVGLIFPLNISIH